MYHTYVQTDIEGRITGEITHNGEQPIPPGYKEVVDRDQVVMVRANSAKYYMPGDELLVRKIVKLVVSSRDMVANGKDQAVIEVKGLAPNEVADVSINGVVVLIAAGAQYKFVTDVQGTFSVAVDSAHLYNRSPWGDTVVIRATAEPAS